MGQNKAIRATRLLCVAINQRKILQQHGFDDEKFELPICKIKLQKLIGERVEEKDAGECKGKIILHHRDSNHDNNPDDGSNWEALCASHHRILHPRAKSTIDTSRTKKLENQKVKSLKNKDILQWQSENKAKKMKNQNAKLLKNKNISHSHEREREKENQKLYQSASEPAIIRYGEMLKNVMCEGEAVKKMRKIMSKHKLLRYSDLCDSIALAVDCSQQTADRYIKKQAAPIGGWLFVFYKNNQKWIKIREKGDNPLKNEEENNNIEDYLDGSLLL